LFQTGTATPDEILRIGQDPDYIYSSELADDIRHAVYLPDSEIEIINPLRDQTTIKHAIFDHDGTISTLREGWELIMAPMMIRAILGEKYHTIDKGNFQKVESRVNEFIDKTTGIQTIAQMKGLQDLIREFGCIPENEMLDASGYKKIYNDELLRMVNRREKKFTRGELSLDDFTLKGVIPCLKMLLNAGIKLYLASGTDEEDVKREAKILGYDYLFEERIFGSIGDITRDAKKVVLDRILDTIGESASGAIITFGDGPVEIRETRKRNGKTVGVASNELKRFGLNEKKRARLIKAGADIVIPDFCQYHQLLGLLSIQ
jgi:phosphoglycolate phosphatase-like HAD superfamily hydrolase